MPRFNGSKLFSLLVFIAYPFVIFFGLSFFEPRIVALGLLVLLALRIDIKATVAAFSKFYIFGFICLGVLLTAVCWLNNALLLRFYPVLINFFMWIIFTISLFRPPTIIEQFARINQPDLSEKDIAYIKTLTKIWSVFLAANTLISLYTATYASLSVWSWYNGLISYLAMGCLLAGDWIFRTFRSQPAHDR